MLSLSEYATQIRSHDWSADFSDSYAATCRADRRKAELVKISKTNKNYARLWNLGLVHHGNITWMSWATDVRPDEVLADKGVRTRIEVHESAWRWIGAYLWVHGVRLSEEEAKALVGAEDGHTAWYNEQISTAKDIDWKKVEAMIKEAT